jgi:hypothetical protein
MTQTNPNVNERGETFEEYQRRVQNTPSVNTVTPEGVVDPVTIIRQNLSDPIVDALRTRLLELERIATKHLLENQSNRQQVRSLVAERERTAGKLAKAAIYRTELKRVHAKHRLVILELKAMKERYDNLVRLGVANEDAAHERGYQEGYQTGHFDGYNEGRSDEARAQSEIDEIVKDAEQFVDEAVEEYFNNEPSNN